LGNKDNTTEFALTELYKLAPIIDGTRQVLQSRTQEELWSATSETLRKIGLTGYCFASRYGDFGWTLTPDATNWPEDECREYVRAEFYKDDPALRAVRMGEPIFRWTSETTYSSQSAQRFMDFLKDTPVKSGCVVGFHNAALGSCVFSASADNRDGVDELTADLVSFLGQAIGLRLLQLRAQKPDRASALDFAVRGNPGFLSQRQHDILRWIADGKTNREVAEILGISHRNVVYHVGEILRKTNAVTRSQAVAWYLTHYSAD
jgi:DNA-binding CsgD family transcriptional regulator